MARRCTELASGRVEQDNGEVLSLGDVLPNSLEAATRAGRGFYVQWDKLALANAASTVLAVKTHATKGMHLKSLQVIAGGSGTLEIKENVTLNATPGGTALTPVNRNRNSATACSQTCRGDPTIDSTAGSVSLATFTVAAGINTFNYGLLAEELMLKDSEDYAIYVTNGSGAPANYSVIAHFYEDAV
jgi:hypothetical protein